MTTYFRTSIPRLGSQVRRAAVLSVAGVLVCSAFAERVFAQRVWHPRITSASPNVVQLNGTLTLNGVDLDPPGWQSQIIYTARYGAQRIAGPPPQSRTATTLAFAAPSMREEDIEILWTIQNESLAQQNTIPATERRQAVAFPIVVVGPPAITFTGEANAADLGAAFPWYAIGSNALTLKGRFLRRTAMPTLTLAGTPLTVLQHTFEPTGSLTKDAAAGSGADRLVFAAPTVPASGWLVVNNSLGKDSAFVTFAGPPRAQQLLIQESDGPRLLSTNVLQRGRTYIVRGQGLSIVHPAPGGTSVKRGTARMGAVFIVPSFASDTNLVFTVPPTLTASSGQLVVYTPLGSSVVGTYQVTNPVVAVGVASVSQAGLSLMASEEAAVIATLTIPPDVDKNALGVLRASVPSSAAGFIFLKDAYPVSGREVEVRVRAMSTQSTVTFPLTIAHESNGVNGVVTQTQQVQVTVRPPRPLSFDDMSHELTAGTKPTVRVLFDKLHRGNSTMFVLLSSSNPNVVNVPPSAVINDARAPFVANVSALDQPTNVTLTATIDGVTISQPVSVRLPRVSAVQLRRYGRATMTTETSSGDFLNLTATFDGDLTGSSSVGITSSDTAIRTMPIAGNDGRSASNAKEWNVRLAVSPTLSEEKQVTVSANFAGSTKSSTITVRPLQITSFSATPSAGRTGTTLSATTILSKSPVSGTRLKYVSGDPSLAEVPASSLAADGLSHVLAIQLKGAPTSPRLVPITVTVSTDNVIIATRTITVTVNP